MATGAHAPGNMAPTTYLEKFSDEGDVLNNAYGPLFDRFAPEAATPTTLLDYLLSADKTVPFVFLCLVEQANRKPMLRAVHRFTLFRRGLAPSPHDDCVYAFVGDVVAGQQIEMARITAELFEDIDEVQVRTMEATAAALDGLAADQQLLPSVTDATGDDYMKITVRRTVPVPHCYLHLVLGGDHEPKRLCQDLLGVIAVEEREHEMKPLVDWLIAAVHRDEDDETESLVSMGEEHDALIQATGRPLLNLKHAILQEDLGAMAPRNARDVSGPIVQVLEHMERSQARERARTRAEKLADKGPKPPSEIYPETTVLWMLVAGVDDDQDLPPVYQRLANVPKKESARQVVQGIIEARRRETTSAAKTNVLLTKEVFEMIKTAQFGSHAYSEDLTSGINPFTCGFGRGPKTRHIEARVDAYDRMERGDAMPTVAEQFYFETKDVVFTDDPFVFQEMMRATSVIIDVIQGVDHPHAMAFRDFARDGVEEVVASLQNMSRLDRQIAGNIYPRATREIQLLMNGYFADLLEGKEPNPPQYTEVLLLARRRKWNLLAELPAEYMLPAQIPEGPPPTPASGRTKTTPDEIPGLEHLGAKVDNKRPTARKWMKDFKDSEKKLGSLQPPKDEDGRDVCMSYHFKGHCFANCPRKYSHCMLVGTTKSHVQSFVDKTFNADKAKTPTPGKGADGPVDDK